MIVNRKDLHIDTAVNATGATPPIDAHAVQIVSIEELNYFSQILNSEKDENPIDKTLNVLLAGIINQDYLFLVTK